MSAVLHDRTIGALNLYSTGRDGFDDAGQDEAHAIAAHIAIAVMAAQQSTDLTAAMDSRSIIGQAMGIVMERYKLDPAAAFAVLVRASSHGGLKLRDVAAELIDSRRMPASVARDEPDDAPRT